MVHSQVDEIRTVGPDVCVLDVKISPGKGHDFHTHPHQEEIILVRSGIVEQWVREERRELRPGDVAFIPMDTVHATFVAPDATVEVPLRGLFEAPTPAQAAGWPAPCFSKSLPDVIVSAMSLDSSR